MILGIILRNFKIYKNINYIPISNSSRFSGLIGVNGIGKSSILEALDSFFNNAPWIKNQNVSQNEDNSSVTPVFLIEKTDFSKLDRELLDVLEKYSSLFWRLCTGQSISISEINSNYREVFDAICKNVEATNCSAETHYLIPIGLTSYRQTIIGLKGDFWKTLYDKDDNLSIDELMDYVTNEYLNKIYSLIKDFYDYIYIPKDVDPERLVHFETQEIQSLLGENLEDVVAEYLSKDEISRLSRKLKDYIDMLSSSIEPYKFKTPSTRQPNLKPSSIYSLIIKEFFSLRELHKTMETEKDLPMSLLSSGEKQQALLSVIYGIMTNYRTENRRVIIAVDEPESSLHISACYEQFERLHQISSICTQVIFSSHWYGFIPAMLSGSVVYLNRVDDKVTPFIYNIAKYREEIKIQNKIAGKEKLPIDIMLKSSNDFIQSIISSVVDKDPYNWILCEGSSELVYFAHYFKEDMEKHKLRIIPLGGAGEIYKAYSHLSLLFSELKESIHGVVVMLMDTDSQLVKFDTKNAPRNLYCYRYVNDFAEKLTKLVHVESNPVSPSTEIEDILNGKIFYKTLIEFKDTHSELLDWLDPNLDISESPSAIALDLKRSEMEKLDNFFNSSPNIKSLFAERYVVNCTEETSVPNWVTEVRSKFPWSNK